MGPALPGAHGGLGTTFRGAALDVVPWFLDRSDRVTRVE